ncbi:MAG TPA: oligosaccharide flippase family protein [Anaeromyxobacter sp.]|nr:oligosaccharide flippase family protein [Anaeromyxobacter sp.]
MADSILTRARPLLVARLAGAALTFAVPMVLARVLVPSSYGTFKQGYLVAVTLSSILPMGLTQSLYYFVPREPAARDVFIAQTLVAHLALGGLAAALFLSGAPLVAAHFSNPELRAHAAWFAALTGFTIAGAPLDVAWNASGRVGAAGLARLATDGGRSAGLAVGALVGGNLRAALAGATIAVGLRAAFALVVLARMHGFRIDPPQLRRQIAYALPFGLAFVLIVPQQQFHQYAVGAAVSAAAFAVYSVGTFQLPIVDVLYSPVSELLQIGLAEVEGAGRPPRTGLPLFHEAVQQLAFAFVPAVGLLVVVAPSLIELLFSPVYLPAVPIFRVGALSVLLAALPLDGVMRARAQNRYMLLLSGAKLGATAALVLAGLAWKGPIGALSGWIAAEGLARAAMLHRAAALFEVPLRRILPLRALFRQAAATACAMPFAWLAVHAVPGPLLGRLAAAGIAYALAYLGISWARGWLPEGWIGLFRGRRARAAATAAEP